VSRKTRRRYRLYAVIAILTVIAGLSGFYMGWRLFNAITGHRPARIEPASGSGGQSPPSAAAPVNQTAPTSPQVATQPTPPTTSAPVTITLSPTGCTVYSYQVAALEKEGSAQAEAARWRARSHPAYVTYLPSSPPPYKVRIGAFSDKAVASAYAAGLKKAGVTGFTAAVTISAAPRTWRGSDAAYLETLRKATDGVGGLVSAEAGWFGAYYQKKTDRAGLKTLADEWKGRVTQAGQGLAAGAPADLSSLSGLVDRAVKAAGTALDDLAAFADGGSAEAYNKAVASYMKLFEAYQAVLAWSGNK